MVSVRPHGTGIPDALRLLEGEEEVEIEVEEDREEGEVKE